MNKNRPKFGCVEVRVIREDSVGEVVDGPGKFDVGKAASRDDEGRADIGGRRHRIGGRRARTSR